ncbi:hypothetical protein [Chromobacterium haemolyticum]|nr:hypothetical protein [Chromobacterium haemolyticum]
MNDQAQAADIQLDAWFQEETFDEAVKMMQEKAVVPFGTALWSV